MGQLYLPRAPGETEGTMRAVLCLLLLGLMVQLSAQQTLMKSFRGLASRRAGQAYKLFRKIRDPVKYKLQYAPVNLRRLLHGYYPKRPRAPVTTKVYHVHHHHYPKKKPLVLKLPKLPSLPPLPPLPRLPKPKLPDIKFPKIKIPKIKVSFEDTEEPLTEYGAPSAYGAPSEYGAPASDYSAPGLSYEAPPVLSAEYDQYGAPEAPILQQEDLESYEPADKVSDLYFSPVEPEVFNIIDISSPYPDSPDTIDIQIVKEDNDDISSAPASFGNSYTSYTNPSTTYSYNSNPASSGVGEYSYIPTLPDEYEDSLASPSDSVVVSVPLQQDYPQSQDWNTNDQQTFFDNLRHHTSAFSDFDPGKTWETFSNWGGKILSSR